jgi:hypothetical protein
MHLPHVYLLLVTGRTMFAHEPDAVREVLLACQLICIPCAVHMLNIYVYTVTWP